MRRVHRRGGGYLWLLKRTDNVGYDEYDACIVVALTKAEALAICPSYDFMSWAGPKDIEATRIGTVHPSKGYSCGDVVFASFNAG